MINQHSSKQKRTTIEITTTRIGLKNPIVKINPTISLGSKIIKNMEKKREKVMTTRKITGLIETNSKIGVGSKVSRDFGMQQAVAETSITGKKKIEIISQFSR